MPKLKDTISVVSKCYLCAAIQRGMKTDLKCSVNEREEIRSGKKKSCEHVQLETAPKKKKKKKSKKSAGET